MIRPFIMLSVIVLFFLSTMLAPGSGYGAAPALSQADLNRVDRYVSDYYQQNDVVGGIYGIVQKNQLVHWKAFGKIREGEALTPAADTLYAIASVTKTFTAAAIYQLEEKELLDLDKPVSTYVPWFQFKQKELSDQVTLRHLLTHAAGGVGSFQTDGLLFADHESRDSLERYIQLMDRIEMQEEPGTSGNYCNGCYDLLGYVIEQVTGMSYYDYMERYVFGQLDMHNTGFAAKRDTYEADKVAEEYTWLFAQRANLYRNNEAFGKAQDPDGGIYSTIEDLARYVAFQLGHAEQPLMNNASIADSRVPYVVTESDEQAFYTASGFEVKKRFGTDLYWKLGDGIGSGSAVMFIPEHDIGIILLTGQFHPELQLPIVEGAAAILLGIEPEAVQSPLTFGKLIGYISIGFSLIGLLLLGSLVFVAFKRKSLRQPRLGWTLAGIVGWGAVAVSIWYLFLFVRPSAIGFYGYPYDAAIGLGLLAISASLWLIYCIVRLGKALSGRRRTATAPSSQY